MLRRQYHHRDVFSRWVDLAYDTKEELDKSKFHRKTHQNPYKKPDRKEGHTYA